jgi:RsiW-degrading membrane proteinase PrsW (M82 family)
VAQFIGEITILVVLFLLVVPALLVKKFGNDKKNNRPWWQFGDYNVIVMSLLWFFILVVVINIISPEPDIDTPDKAVDFGKRRGIPQYAQWGYEQKMLGEQTNLFFHLKALDLTFESARNRKRSWFKNFFISNGGIDDFYEKLSNSDNKDLRDAGNFGTAYALIMHNSSKLLAREHLEKISDQQKPCVQYLYALLEEDFAGKEPYYKKDLANKGNLQEDIDWLSSFYYATGNHISLLELYQDPNTFKFLNTEFKKIISFRNGHYFDFLLYDFQYVFKSWNVAGITGALLIFLTWLYYIRRIDLFEKERKRHVLLVILLGCAFTFLSAYLYHFENYYLNFSKTGESLNDLAYYIIGVGMLEELMKIIPFLILLRFTKAINEPMDYIIFGALSAISFAFIENILYFDEDGMYNIHSRALWCVMVHMGCTCIITYMLMLAKWSARL